MRVWKKGGGVDAITAPATIGSVASAVGTVYFVWMLYDDWQPLSHLGSCRQLLWSCVHFPFHLTLVLFVGGSAQFIVWFKIIESLQSLPSYAFVNPSDNSMAFTTTGNVTKSGLIQSMGQIVHEIFEMFPPKNYVTLFDLNWAEGSLNNLSDAFWGNITNPQEQSGQLNPEEVNTFVQALTTLDNLVVNSLFETFQIDALNEIEYTNASEFEQAVYHANTDRFEMVVRSPAQRPAPWSRPPLMGGWADHTSPQVNMIDSTVDLCFRVRWRRARLDEPASHHPPGEARLGAPEHRPDGRQHCHRARTRPLRAHYPQRPCYL